MTIIKKAKNRLYGLSQLKPCRLGPRGLVKFFCTCIRQITEYACPVFHDVYLSNELECLQKRANCALFFLFVHTMRPWLNRA